MRLPPDARRAMIVRAAADLAATTSLAEITYDTAASACPVPTSASTVRYHFKTYRSLWLAIANHDRENLWDQAVALGVADARK